MSWCLYYETSQRPTVNPFGDVNVGLVQFEFQSMALLPVCLVRVDTAAHPPAGSCIPTCQSVLPEKRTLSYLDT